MSSVLFFCGSPRIGGNTDDCAKYIAARAGSAGHDVEVVRIYDHDIKPCWGCRFCMQVKDCAITGDDFHALWDKVSCADLLIVASPVYWFGPPGRLKDFVDGLTASTAVDRPLGGLKAALLSCAAEDGCWGPHERILSSWLQIYGAELLGPAHVIAREKGEGLASEASLAALDSWAEMLREAIE